MADKDTVEYDPNYYFPDEYVEMEAVDLGEEQLPDDEADVDVFESDDTSDLEELDDTQVEVEVPEIISIVQNIRTASDGRQVVDLVIEVEDIEDAVQFDVRVTKP